jgi:5-methylthioribose kinase
MIELSAANAAAYLEACAPPLPGPWRITPLGGGVSNTVLLVECEAGRFVMKQSLAKLRVQEDWFADRHRIHRECAALRALAPHLPAGAVPRVVFEDPANCLYAMDAAPAGARDWKTLLLAGEVSDAVAASVAGILSAQIRATHRQEGWRRDFGDQTCFDQLRLDPYYRFTASRHPDLARFFEERIDACRRQACAIVHGDFSPKNFLVDSGRVMAIDFEVVHYGDPSFDAAFLLNHLLLKSIHRPQWAPMYRCAAAAFWDILAKALPPGMEWFESSTLAHLGCLHLARVDGKSPAEYLTSDQEKECVRRVARSLILEPPAGVLDAFDRIECL